MILEKYKIYEWIFLVIKRNVPVVKVFIQSDAFPTAHFTFNSMDNKWILSWRYGANSIFSLASIEVQSLLQQHIRKHDEKVDEWKNKWAEEQKATVSLQVDFSKVQTLDRPCNFIDYAGNFNKRKARIHKR